MTLRWKLRLAALAISAIIAFAIMFFRFHSHNVVVGDLMISHARSVATAPGAPVAGGYMAIRNSGDVADFLLGATAAFAGSVTLHETRTVDGVMQMRPVKGGLEIPAGQTVKLDPKGFHLMFVDLAHPMKADEMPEITLHFEKAGDVDVSLHVTSTDDSDHSAH